MKDQSRSPTNDRPLPIKDEHEKPNFDPIRDDCEPLKEPPQKKPPQIGEGSDDGAEKYAESISSYLAHADVDADTKAAAPKSAGEAAALIQAEVDASARSADTAKMLRRTN